MICDWCDFSHLNPLRPKNQMLLIQNLIFVYKDGSIGYMPQNFSGSKQKISASCKILFSLFCPRKWAMKKETATALFSIDIEQKSVEYENGPIWKNNCCVCSCPPPKYDKNGKRKIAVKVYHTKTEFKWNCGKLKRKVKCYDKMLMIITN